MFIVVIASSAACFFLCWLLIIFRGPFCPGALKLDPVFLVCRSFTYFLWTQINLFCIFLWILITLFFFLWTLISYFFFGLLSFFLLFFLWTYITLYCIFSLDSNHFIYISFFFLSSMYIVTTQSNKLGLSAIDLHFNCQTCLSSPHEMKPEISSSDS